MVRDLVAARGPAAAELLEALALLRVDDEDEVPGPETDVEALAAATALRVSITQAEYAVRDAHNAVSDLPVLLEALRDGILPEAWMTQILKRSRRLAHASRHVLDQIIPDWDLAGMSPDSFRTHLAALVRWLEDHERPDEQDEAPVERSVSLVPLTRGLACLQIVGPAPELVQTARRLDVTARAIRDAQRAALREGTEIPDDPDGTVAAAGAPLRLSTLRYLLVTRASLDVGGVVVPRDRFRVTVTVPALTLLGETDVPGMLDGAVPVPADLARHLAGDEETWYRVLTDPGSGAFLPLPATTYRPTAAMVEHLRLRGPRCAVPSCARPVSDGAECDHIEEYLAGGVTAVENLHMLCRHHHQQKTAGLLDPVRLHEPGATPGGARVPGATRWRIGTEADPLGYATIHDDVDLVGTLAVKALRSHYLEHPGGLCDRSCLQPGNIRALKIGETRDSGEDPGRRAGPCSGGDHPPGRGGDDSPGSTGMRPGENPGSAIGDARGRDTGNCGPGNGAPGDRDAGGGEVESGAPGDDGARSGSTVDGIENPQSLSETTRSFISGPSLAERHDQEIAHALQLDADPGPVTSVPHPRSSTPAGSPGDPFGSYGEPPF
ncbi:HNH endonuclease signature motif containing protein [Brachybacterium hainanense]|uniref:HNH endonuclease n=1 Tax=Brachybacterium hainanense TaxID=1541174 RepID=A0ABV6RHK1_9MICO